MKYVLHIGTHKTGSKSLQRAFHSNRDALRMRRVVYPETGCGIPVQREMARIFKGGAPDPKGFSGEFPGDWGHHKLVKAIRGDDLEQVELPEDWRERFHAETEGAEICVVSSESFHSVSEPELVASIFPPDRTLVALYLREPVDFIVSMYQQMVKAQNITKSLREYVETSFPSYSDIANEWIKVFGRENVALRKYDRGDLVGGDIVSDFANLVQPGLEDLFLKQKHALNPSIAGNLLFIKRILNFFITMQESWAIKFELQNLGMLDSGFRGKIPVDQETVNWIGSFKKPDCEALAERFDLTVMPRNGPIEGPSFPDHDKLAHDFARILEEARENKLVMEPMLWRMAEMFPSGS